MSFPAALSFIALSFLTGVVPAANISTVGVMVKAISFIVLPDHPDDKRKKYIFIIGFLVTTWVRKSFQSLWKSTLFMLACNKPQIYLFLVLACSWKACL